MPFCCQCGKTVADATAFCGHCGARQDSAKPSPEGGLGSGIDARTASMLCYIPVMGWIPSIFVLASQRFRNDREVRFHAFQGLYLFVAWLIVDWGIGPFFAFGTGRWVRYSVEQLMKLALLVVWGFMIVKTSQRVTFRLPVLGDLAERSVSEQR